MWLTLMWHQLTFFNIFGKIAYWRACFSKTNYFPNNYFWKYCDEKTYLNNPKRGKLPFKNHKMTAGFKVKLQYFVSANNIHYKFSIALFILVENNLKFYLTVFNGMLIFSVRGKISGRLARFNEYSSIFH